MQHVSTIALGRRGSFSNFTQQKRYDQPVINAGQFLNGLWMGTVLILLGLVPDILQRAAVMMFRIHAASRFRTEIDPEAIRAPRWLAMIGAAIILLSTLAYIA